MVQSLRSDRVVETRAKRRTTMKGRSDIWRSAFLSLALLGTSSGTTDGSTQGGTPQETVRAVERLLERLPYYGVFDYLVFRVERNTVYLAGYSFEGRLK